MPPADAMTREPNTRQTGMFPSKYAPYQTAHHVRLICLRNRTEIGDAPMTDYENQGIKRTYPSKCARKMAEPLAKELSQN